MDEINVQVKFTKEENGIKYTDALYFPYGDFPNVKQADVEAEKTKRFENFKQVIANPVEPVVPDPIDIQAQIDDLTAQLNVLNTQLVEVKAVQIDPITPLEEIIS